jgi:uncharacterized phage protein (predicted DNA packaging)
MAIITLEDAKAHLNITDDADDDLITAKIDAATAMLASALGFDIEEKFGTGIPADIEEACRQLVGHLYENREATLVGAGGIAVLPYGVDAVIADYRSYAWGVTDAA